MNQEELLLGGIPCSNLRDSDPESQTPGCQNMATHFDSEGNPWCADCAGLKKGTAKVITQSELNRLAQQLHDLREALKPFAFFGSSLPPIDPAVERITDSGAMFNVYANQVNYTITCADLRRATTLLKKLEEQDVHVLVSNTEDEMTKKSLAELVTEKRKLIAEVTKLREAAKGQK